MPRIELRCTDAFLEQLDALCIDKGWTRSDVIRDAVEKLSGSPRALTQPVRAEEPKPLKQTPTTIEPSTQARPVIVPKIRGLVPASELPPAALCKCGHTAIRHYNKNGACSSCEDRSCQSFKLT